MAPSNSGGNFAATTVIVPTSVYLDRLRSLMPSTEAQKKAGYVTERLTQPELQQKKRCIRCRARPFRKPRARKPRSEKPKSDEPAIAPEPTSSGTEVQVAAQVEQVAKPPPNPPSRPPSCPFHTGQVVFKKWTCCGKHVSEQIPCSGADDHLLPEDPGDRALERRWQMTETPAQVLPGHRRAVAIDCEMGHASDGESELIRLTAVDYFSGKTLIDTLVYPDIPMQHFNTKWSGVTRSQMDNARRRQQCLFGIAAARKAVFQFVGRHTTVVGHGLSQDLLSLRWCHGYIVDSYLIESNIREARLKAEAEKEIKVDHAAQPGDERQAEDTKETKETKETKGGKTGGKGHPDGMSLKALAMKRLGRSIQGGKGHDSLEDAVAARDLVHSYVVDMLTPSVS